MLLTKSKNPTETVCHRRLCRRRWRWAKVSKC